MSSIRNVLMALACALMLIAAMKPASAATISYDVIFSAGSFNSVPPGTTPPHPLVMGQFNVALDPGTNSGGPLAFDFMLPIVFDVPMNYQYTALTDTLLLFNFSNTQLYIQNFTTNPLFQLFIYESGGTTFNTQTGLVHVTATATTPIPAALPLFAAALGGLGIAAWRRRRGTAAA
jgi:hypothetical protein